MTRPSTTKATCPRCIEWQTKMGAAMCPMCVAEMDSYVLVQTPRGDFMKVGPNYQDCFTEQEQREKEIKAQAGPPAAKTDTRHGVLVPEAALKALQVENKRLKEALHLMMSQAGIPDSAEACRTIIKTGREFLKATDRSDNG